MTDILLGIIIAIILLQLHQKEKHMGWYGKIYTIIRRRFKRYIKDMLKGERSDNSRAYRATIRNIKSICRAGIQRVMSAVGYTEERTKRIRGNDSQDNG